METGIITIIVIAVVLVTIFGLLIDFILYKDMVIENCEEEIELLRKKEKTGESEEAWVARDSTGDLFCYKSKPIRGFSCTQWMFDYKNPWKGPAVFKIPNNLFPELTWKDEPIKISITYKKQEK